MHLVGFIVCTYIGTSHRFTTLRSPLFFHNSCIQKDKHKLISMLLFMGKSNAILWKCGLHLCL